MPDRRRARFRFFAAVATGILVPATAQAHMPIDGIDGFYTGLLHPLGAFQTLLPLLGLAMVLGLSWPRAYGTALAVFAGAAALGALAGTLGTDFGALMASLLGAAVLSATLAALFPAGHWVLSLAFAGAVGALSGLALTPDPGPLRATLFTLAGSYVAIVATVFYVSAAASVLQQKLPYRWVTMGLRIAAAWLAAISVMMAALSLAPSA